MTVVIIQPDFTTSKDTWLQINNPTFTRGFSGTLLVGMSAGGLQRHALIAFTDLLTQVPPGSLVSSAILGIFVQSEINTTDRTISAYRSLVEWWSGNLDGAAPGAGTDASSWSNRNQNPSNVLPWLGGAGGAAGLDWEAVATGSVVITTTGIFFDIDVTADVQGFVDGTYPNQGWWLHSSAPLTAGSAKTLGSAETGTSSQRPKLTITFTSPGLLPKLMQYGQYSGGTL